MDKTSKIYVAGHRGLVGSALMRRLGKGGYEHLVTRTHKELNLLHQAEVHEFMQVEKPDYIFLAAAKVGGIRANNELRADFIYQNMVIETNVVHAAYKADTGGLMFLGSSCIYPRDCPQPMKEEHLLTGPLEQTNEPYAVAKIAGIKLCESFNRQYGTNYVSVMPTNLYGPHDNFDLQFGHVLPALIRKIHEAKINNDKTVPIWGTGKPKREFLHVDDMADACVFLMEKDSRDGIYNIGAGVDATIHEAADTIKEVVGYEGQFQFDTSMPDGTLRKLLDVSRMTGLGWKARYTLKEGLNQTYEWYVENVA